MDRGSVIGSSENGDMGLVNDSIIRQADLMSNDAATTIPGTQNNLAQKEENTEENIIEEQNNSQ